MGYIADDKVAALPYSQNWKSMPREHIFVLSFLIAKQSVPLPAIGLHSTRAPPQDLILFGSYTMFHTAFLLP
jgi:hypothetical protein